MPDSLDLSQLVALLSDQTASDDTRATARLIQNWVTAGLVRPLPRDRGGRGVRRRFDRAEARKIAVLLELNRHRLPWSILQIAGALFDDQRELPAAIMATRSPAALSIQNARHGKRRALLNRAISGESPIFLLIKPADGATPAVQLTSNDAEILKGRSATVVNLTEVLRPYR